MARRQPQSREQYLRRVISLIPQRQRQGSPQAFGPESTSPEFAYPATPYRDPFMAPLPALQVQAGRGRAGGSPRDARGMVIAPEILRAMDLMRAKRAAGFKTHGDQAREEFLQRGGARVSPLWGG